MFPVLQTNCHLVYGLLAFVLVDYHVSCVPFNPCRAPYCLLTVRSLCQ